MLDIGQRATSSRPLSHVYCYTDGNNDYLCTSIAVYMMLVRAKRLLINYLINIVNVFSYTQISNYLSSLYIYKCYIPQYMYWLD